MHLKLKQAEPVTFYIALSYFLLLFAYKLFSPYYPLFLALQGFSFLTVGSMYLLIYLTIAFSSPLMNFLVRKFDARNLLALGVFGYGIYALSMILVKNVFQFAIMQILLGTSSALYNVSARTILISSKPKSYDKSFSYFYSAPFYSGFLGPLIGGAILLKFNFTGVFVFSLLVCIFSGIFSYSKLKKFKLKQRKIDLKNYFKNYSVVFKLISKLFILFLFLAFFLQFLVGFYRAFFVLFLKSLGYVRSQIIFYVIACNFIFIPISWFLPKIICKGESEKNISLGLIISGIATFIIARLTNIFEIFIFSLTEFAGRVIGSSGESGLLARKLEKYKEEAATIDTVLISLAVALGALAGGVLVNKFGFSFFFSILGIISIFLGIFGFLLRKKL